MEFKDKIIIKTTSCDFYNILILKRVKIILKFLIVYTS